MFNQKEENMNYALHSPNIKQLAVKMARKLNLSPKTFLLLAENHDIGKIQIPHDILHKEGPLTPNEWVIMKLHPEIGYRIAKSIPKLNSIANYILFHHERWDGEGYPHKLKGTEIPLEARAVAILDAYDAMTTDRPYKRAMSREEAIKELKKNAGTQFDPKLVEIFIKEVLA